MKVAILFNRRPEQRRVQISHDGADGDVKCPRSVSRESVSSSHLALAHLLSSGREMS